MCTSMNVIMVWAWMLLLSEALEQGLHNGVGYKCGCYRMHSTRSIIIVWAWMLLFSDAPNPSRRSLVIMVLATMLWNRMCLKKAEAVADIH